MTTAVRAEEKGRAKLAIALLLVFFGSSQWLMVVYGGDILTPAGLISAACWLGFAWNLEPSSKQRIKLFFLPSIVLSLAGLTTWMSHTDGYYGWSDTLAKAVFLSFIWLCDVLRRRCADLEAVWASRLFSISELASIVTLILLLFFGAPLPPGPSLVALGAMGSIVLSAAFFLVSGK